MNLPWPFSRLLRNSSSRTSGKITGDWGEQIAARHLETKGYRILGRNVRFGSRCELDIVARSPAPDVLVFVEVKTRRSDAFGRPSDSVGRAKQRALARAAEQYLRRLRRRPAHIRFDVVEVLGSPDAASPLVRHIENAFSRAPGYRYPW